MSFKVYKGDYLTGYGSPLLIVTNANSVKNSQKIIYECHAFFTADPNTYGFIRFEIDKEIDSNSLAHNTNYLEIAKQLGEEHIYNIICQKMQFHYYAILAASGYKITLVDNNQLLAQHHIKNDFSGDIEINIIKKTNNAELKAHIMAVAALDRIKLY